MQFGPPFVAPPQRGSHSGASHLNVPSVLLEDMGDYVLKL